MKGKITEALKAVVKQMQATRQQMEKARAEVLETMGIQLLSNSLLDYETKGRGGTGTDGITWKQNAPATIRRKNRRGSQKQGRKTKGGKSLPGPSQNQIGVDSGLQRASASPGFIGKDGKGGNFFEQDATSVTVGYNREYSEHFDEQRKLLPEELPKQWQDQLEEIVEDWANKILEEGIGGL